MATRNLYNVFHDQRATKYVVYRQSYRDSAATFTYTGDTDKAQAMEAAFNKRKALNAEAAEASAARKAAKTAQAKTCQCCARQIFAETGTIAHHGYERPGYGYQTASCMGAKYLPFEADRSRLGLLIEALKKRLLDQINMRKAADAEAMPVLRHYSNTNAPRDKSKATRFNPRGDYPVVVIEWTRATFAALIEQNTGDRDSGKLFDSYTGHCKLAEGFDSIKASDLASRDQQIKMTHEHLAECERRFAGWKQTHKWEGGEWITV